MATFYSNVAAKQTETNAGKLLPIDIGGRVRVAHGVYTSTGAEKNGDKVILCRLPKGARILPLGRLDLNPDFSCNIWDGDNRTVKDPDFVTTEEFDVTLEVSGVANHGAGDKIRFDICYVID